MSVDKKESKGNGAFSVGSSTLLGTNMQRVKFLQDFKNMVDSNSIKDIYIKKLEHRSF